jgi:hypothetical protein
VITGVERVAKQEGEDLLALFGYDDDLLAGLSEDARAAIRRRIGRA